MLEIMTEADVAGAMGVAANGLGRMVEEGTIPAPEFSRQRKSMWSRATIESWFKTIQPSQAAYAPINRDTGFEEFDSLGCYVCPAISSGHIGTRRPSQLVLWQAGQKKDDFGATIANVYDVTAIQTTAGVVGESIITRNGASAEDVELLPWEDIRPGNDGDITVFQLDLDSRQELRMARGFQRGGTLHSDSLSAALASPSGMWAFRGGEAIYMGEAE